MTRKIMTMILVLATIPCFAQGNLLQITSPASGTIVDPGQMVVISVSADPSVSNVAILGQNPLGFSATTNGQSLQFQLTIPSNTTIGPYDVSALGTAADGSPVASPPISLQVDNLQPFTMQTQPSVLRFSAPGRSIPLHVIGTFADGSQHDMTHSVQLSYSSQNPQIATVDGQGVVTAVASGSTHMVVTNVYTYYYGSYSYSVSTKVGQLATMSIPGVGSMLPGSSVTFQWTSSNTATAYWIDVGSTQGGNNYYQSGSLPTTTLSQTVNNLPTDGSNIYVTLWTEINGQWANNQYTYTAFNPAAYLAAIQSPDPGSTLTGSSQLFTWSQVVIILPSYALTLGSGSSSAVIAYWIDAGSTPGGNQYFQSGNIGNVNSYTVTGLPIDGSQIYVTLWTQVNGQWFNKQYTYTAFNPAAGLGTMQTPPPGSVLSGNTIAFAWSAGSGASAYWLDVGSSPGGNTIYQSGNLGNVLSTTVSTLPADGSQIYVTLWSLVNGQWFNNQYTYTSGP
jgi:hypothetical protein